MAAVPHLLSAFPDVIDRNFLEIYVNQLKRWKKQYTYFFGKKETKRGYETFGGLTGYGLVPVKPEGEAMILDSIKQGYDVTIHTKTRAFASSVTKEAKKFGKLQKIGKMAQQAAVSFLVTKETQAAVIFNYGHVTTYNTGGDDKAFFATDHPRPDGSGTWSNEPATDTALSEDSLRAGMLAMEALTDDRGLLCMMVPKRLVVPPALKWLAGEMLESTKRHNTSNNDKNMFKGLLNYFVYRYITSTTQWMLIADKSECEMIYLEGWGLNTDTDKEILTLSDIYANDENYGFGFTGGRYIRSSLGTG